MKDLKEYIKESISNINESKLADLILKNNVKTNSNGEGMIIAIVLKSGDNRDYDVVYNDASFYIPAYGLKDPDNTFLIKFAPKNMYIAKRDVAAAIKRLKAKQIEKFVTTSTGFPHRGPVNNIPACEYEVQVYKFNPELLSDPKIQGSLDDLFYIAGVANAPFGVTNKDRKAFWEPEHRFFDK